MWIKTNYSYIILSDIHFCLDSRNYLLNIKFDLSLITKTFFKQRQHHCFDKEEQIEVNKK